MKRSTRNINARQTIQMWLRVGGRIPSLWPHSASWKDGEVGVRRRGLDGKEAATGRPQLRTRRQHVQRPCDRMSLAQWGRLKPVQLGDGGTLEMTRGEVSRADGPS